MFGKVQTLQTIPPLSVAGYVGNHKITIAGFLLAAITQSGASAQTAPTGYVSDANVPVVAATTPNEGFTYLLNRDESVLYLDQGGFANAGCPALDSSTFVAGQGLQQNVIYDATANRVYIMSPLADDDPGIVYETPDPQGDCNPSPAVDLPGFLNYSETMVSDAAESNLYVVDSHQGGSGDVLYVLNTNSFAAYSTSSPPPSYNLDYDGSYGAVAVDPSSHLVYLPETSSSSGATGGPGFWVFNPVQNQIVRVLGYINPTTGAEVNIDAVAVLIAGSGKIAIVNANPNGSSANESTPLIQFDTTKFSFFTNTESGSGSTQGVYIEPPADAITTYAASTEYSNISAAAIDPVNGVVYVAAYLENSSGQVVEPGYLLSYNLAATTTPETPLSTDLLQPTTSNSTTYAGWSRLTWDAYTKELILFNSYYGTGTMAISTPITSNGVSVAVIAASGFNPLGVVYNPNTGFIYAPSVQTPGTPTNPTVYYFQPSNSGPAADSLTLTAPATAAPGVAFNATLVFQSAGTGTPTGNIVISETPSGGAAQQVGIVSAATALAAGISGTPVAITLPDAGTYSLTASYAGDANFAAAASTGISIDATAYADSLTLTVPNTATAGKSFTVDAIFTSSGTATPTGNIVISAAAGSGSPQQVATVSGATALAAGSPGTPVSVTLAAGGIYSISAAYAGDAQYAAAASPEYEIEALLPTPPAAGMAALIPGIISTVETTAGSAGSMPTAVAFDASSNLYVLDSGLNTVTRYPVSGSPVTIVPQSGQSTTLNTPSDMILEANGASLLISDYGNNRLVRVTLGSSNGIAALAVSGVPAPLTACSNVVAGTSLCEPTGLAEDANGNIYESDSGSARVMEFASTGTYASTVVDGAASGVTVPLGVAVDGSGNVYVANSSDTAAAGSILKVSAQGNVQTITGGGILQPYGLTADAAGDIYFSDQGALTVSVIDAAGVNHEYAGNGNANDSGDNGPATSAGLISPLGLVLDAAGNLYIADTDRKNGDGGLIRKVDASQAILDFGNVSESTASPALDVTVLNGGAATLGITAAVVSGTNSGDFAAPDTCPANLSAGLTCQLGVTFTPSTASTETATLTLTDNSGGTAGATQTVQFNGAGTQEPVAATPVFTPAAGTYPAGQTITITSATATAQIYYTTNGSTPSKSSTLYTAPIALKTAEVLSAIAIASGYANSAVATASYSVEASPAATPTFSPAAGAYTEAQTVTIASTTPNATIYYTTNGSTPGLGSTAYSGALTVSQTETINAIAVAPGYAGSAIGTATYLINPSFTMLGSYNGSTPAATIAQTIDVYNNPLQVVTLTLTAVNGYNSVVNLSSDFNGTNNGNGGKNFAYCASDTTGRVAVSCAVTPTAGGTTVYFAFSQNKPQETASGAVRRTGPVLRRRNAAKGASMGLLGSIAAMALFGIFWRRRGLFAAMVILCLTTATVSMGVILAGCNDTGSFSIYATPSTGSPGSTQTVAVTLHYEGNN
jgi:sugar lactone lactonase YvrE